jgi:hypothetical protein
MGSLILAAIVLAVVGGIIAYGGDRLGTYVGKKRISFKWKRISLRPRHTATLYTTFSGSAIALLTLFLLVGADSAFKRALLEGPQLIFDNQHYKTLNRGYQAQIVKDQKTAADATLQLKQAQSLLAPVRERLGHADHLLSRNQKALQLRQQQLGQAQARLVSAQASLGSTDQQLRLARAEVQHAKQAVLGAETNVRLARQKVTLQQQRLSALTTVGRHLKTANAELKTVNAELQTKNTQLKLESDRLAERTASSQHKLIYRTEQELGRLVVKAAQPVPVIENDLTSFLDSLGRTAAARGATKGVWDRAVVVAVPVSPDSSEYGPLSLIDERKAIETLAQQIALQSPTIHSVVVVAHTVTNTFQGEQAYIRLQPYENALIYPKNTPIATSTISGLQTPFQIGDALGTFLTDKVRPAVLSQGLIPQTDPETGQPMIGAVLDEAASQALVMQIERMGGEAHVTAYASEDTYSSGPLHLRFDVTPVGPPVSAPPPAAVGGRA